MCIIAAKPAGIPMPNRDTIRTMWDGNSDGAGLMYIENGRVHIEKGFMKYKKFAKALDRLERKLDLTQTPVVMHFRITTHGGTKPENTHPFPITDSISALKKLDSHTDIGVAHNGIIHIVPRAGISDTMEYIASQLAPLKRALPRFYENKNAMQLVKNAIESKMAFLTKEGKIYTVGDFIEDGGILYSNNSYKALRFRYGSYGCYGSGYAYSGSLDSDWDWYDDYKQYGSLAQSASKQTEPDGVKALMWLEDSDYITTMDGTMIEGTEYLIDVVGTVWKYDWESDLAIRVINATAKTKEGTPVRFKDEESESLYVNLNKSTNR